METFCIYVPSREQRIREHLKDLDVHYFPAFQGKTLRVKGQPYLRDHEADFWAVNPEFFCGEGVLSLVLSNLAIMKYCIMHNIQDVLILEDDIVIDSNFKNKVYDIFNALPDDYYSCHLQSCCVDTKRIYKPELNLYRGCALCTGAVIYSLEAMKILDQNTYLSAPWDVVVTDYISRRWPDNAFVVDPQMCRQLSASGELPTTLS